MGLPELKTRSFRFVDLPESVWKVQLLPRRIPIPEEMLAADMSHGMPQEKLYEFIRDFLDVAENYDDIVYYENAIKAHEFGYKAISIHRSGKHKEALKWYQRALEFEPESWICHYNLAFCYLQLKELDKAFEVISGAIQCLAAEPRNYALLGDIFVQKKSYVQAYGAYHQFLRYARSHGVFARVAFQLRFQLGLLEEREPRLKKLHPFPFDGRCICGVTWDFPKKCPGGAKEGGEPHGFRDKRFARVTDWHLQTALQCHHCDYEVEGHTCPNCAREYHWALGTLKTYFPVDDLQHAQELFFDYGGEDKKIKSDAESILQDVSFALLEFRYQDALDLLYRASHLIFENPIFHYKLVEVFRLMGKENEGVHHYENILRLQPESVCGRYGLALLASTPTTALRLFQEIILSDRAFAPAYNGIGDILMEEDKGDEALEYLLRALDLDPTWVPVYRSLAMLFQTRGDENLAIHFRNSLHRLAPYFDDRHENSYLAFATKLKGQKEYTRSNEVLTSIAEIARAAASTDEQRVHFELGFEPWLKVKRISNLLDMGQTWTAEEMLGQLTRMINDISTDQTIQDGGPDLRLNLAKTLIDEGLADEAHDYLQKAAVDATPLDPAAVEWLETYDEDRRRMRHVLSGDRSLTKDEVTTFAVRTLTEVRGDKKGTGVFIDGEGLIVVPKSVVGDREEVEVLTYDGLVLAAKVIVHSRKAPFCIVKVPPLGEGVYFHFSLFQVPILHGQDPLIVVGQNDEGDYLHGELHLHQDVLDGNGVRYLLMDRPLEKAMDGAMVITEKGALVGFSMVLPKSDPQFRGRLVLDSDAVAHLACGIRKDFPFLYHSSFCGECGARLRPFQKTCACGTSDDDSDVGSV